MNLSLRERRLCALDVAPLRLRRRTVGNVDARPIVEVQAPATTPTAVAAPARIARLALHADPAERRDPAIDKMYVALSEAIGKAGLQPVRPCDVADDPTAAVMVFGNAAIPAGVPAVRVLRVDPLTVLHADRERKRQLWERMRALGRAGRS